MCVTVTPGVWNHETSVGVIQMHIISRFESRTVQGSVTKPHRTKELHMLQDAPIEFKYRMHMYWTNK